jgi:serine/threonine protein kinase
MNKEYMNDVKSIPDNRCVLQQNSCDSKDVLLDKNSKSSYVFFDDYKVQKKSIGSGSFCKVYKGYDRNTKECVAIKKINIDEIIKKKASYSKNVDKLKANINNEIKIIESLDHINIAKCNKIIRSSKNNNICIVMEFCEGGTLNEYKKNNKINIDKIIKQIIDGINYLHIKGIVHRDLKPENIMFKNNIVKIIDFGFARKYTAKTEMFKTLCGTPLYFAPEMINDKIYTIKADIWSLGVIFYELVFDKYPFLIKGNYPMDIQTLMKIIDTKKIDYNINLIKNNVDTKCIDLIYDMLQRDPKDRIEWNNLLAHPYFFNVDLNPSVCLASLQKNNIKEDIECTSSDYSPITLCNSISDYDPPCHNIILQNDPEKINSLFIQEPFSSEHGSSREPFSSEHGSSREPFSSEHGSSREPFSSEHGSSKEPIRLSLTMQGSNLYNSSSKSQKLSLSDLHEKTILNELSSNNLYNVKSSLIVARSPPKVSLVEARSPPKVSLVEARSPLKASLVEAKSFSKDSLFFNNEENSDQELDIIPNEEEDKIIKNSKANNILRNVIRSAISHESPENKYVGDNIIIDNYVDSLLDLNDQKSDEFIQYASKPINIKPSTKHSKIRNIEIIKKGKTYTQTVYSYISSSIEYIKSFSPSNK